MEAGRVLKARAPSAAGSIAFNFEDLRTQCDEYIARINVQAQEILQEAARQGEAQRQELRAKGVAEGREQGLRDAAAEIAKQAEARAAVLVAEQVQTALPALQMAISQIQAEREVWLATWETAAVELSVAIAERILRHSVARDPQVSVHLIRDALQLAAGDRSFVLRVHPKDLARLQALGASILQSLEIVAAATVSPDPQVSEGGCVIETTFGVIDARLETQLDRISQELLGAGLDEMDA